MLVEASTPTVQHVEDRREYALKQWQRFGGSWSEIVAPSLSRIDERLLAEAQEAFVSEATTVVNGLVDEEGMLSCTLTWLWVVAKTGP